MSKNDIFQKLRAIALSENENTKKNANMFFFISLHPNEGFKPYPYHAKTDSLSS